MRCRLYLPVNLKDMAIRIDHISDAPGRFSCGSIASAIQHADFAVRVAKERKRVIEFFGEGRVLIL